MARLHDMRELVRDERVAARRIGPILAAIEDHVSTHGERGRAEALSRLCRALVGVDANAAEVELGPCSAAREGAARASREAISLSFRGVARLAQQELARARPWGGLHELGPCREPLFEPMTFRWRERS